MVAEAGVPIDIELNMNYWLPRDATAGFYIHSNNAPIAYVETEDDAFASDSVMNLEGGTCTLGIF